jgi:8-oxo-dGTP diphosphatase
VGTRVSRDLLAAGAVLWRPSGGERDGAEGIEVALVHRPRYDDWSLPKGKVEAGEHLAQTAAREVAEETGHLARLGRPLGTTEYRVPAGRKTVRYWEATPVGEQVHAPAAGEVDEVRWLPLRAALAHLSYAHERAPIRRLVARPFATATLLLVRHAKAGSRREWKGDDDQRPLDSAGRAQADRLEALLLVWGPRRVLSADRVRCVQTVEPLARAVGTTVESEPRFSEEGHAEDPDKALALVRELARQSAGAATVLCSQGGAIPAMVAALARTDGVALPSRGPDKVPARKGSTWVLSFAGDRLVDAEYLPSPEPALP